MIPRYRSAKNWSARLTNIGSRLCNSAAQWIELSWTELLGGMPLPSYHIAEMETVPSGFEVAPR